MVDAGDNDLCSVDPIADHIGTFAECNEKLSNILMPWRYRPPPPRAWLLHKAQQSRPNHILKTVGSGGIDRSK